MQTTLEPIIDFCNALFNGTSLPTGPNVTLQLTQEQNLNPLLWIAAVEDPGMMQELLISNKYAQLLLILYDASLKEIQKLNLTEAGVRSLIYRLGLTEQLKQEARGMLKYELTAG